MSYKYPSEQPKGISGKIAWLYIMTYCDCIWKLELGFFQPECILWFIMYVENGIKNIVHIWTFYVLLESQSKFFLYFITFGFKIHLFSSIITIIRLPLRLVLTLLKRYYKWFYVICATIVILAEGMPWPQTGDTH